MTVKLRPTLTYQDSLRAVGAWLDIRGYREVRIFEDADALVVEAACGKSEAAAAKEVFRLDSERIQRLRLAALSDRGAPRAWPSVPPSAQESTDLVKGDEPTRRPN